MEADAARDQMAECGSVFSSGAEDTWEIENVAVGNVTWQGSSAFAGNHAAASKKSRIRIECSGAGVCSIAQLRRKLVGFFKLGM